MTDPPVSSADLATLAELIRARCLAAGEAAYEDAGIQGLCAEGRWEVAVGAMKSVDLTALLREIAGTPGAGEGPRRAGPHPGLDHSPSRG